MFGYETTKKELRRLRIRKSIRTFIRLNVRIPERLHGQVIKRKFTTLRDMLQFEHVVLCLFHVFPNLELPPDFSP